MVTGAEEAVWAGMQGLRDRSPDGLVPMAYNRDRGQDPAATCAPMPA